MIAYFVKNRVLTNLLFIFFLTLGFNSFISLPREAFPEMSFGTVIITTVWPGANPSDVEKQITIPLEEKLSEIENIYRFTSNSMYGFSKLSIKFDEDLNESDYLRLYTEVQNKMGEINVLPQNSRAPITSFVKVQDWKPAIKLSVSGIVDEGILKRTAKDLKRKLLKLNGVQNVDLNGVRDDQIHIEINKEKMHQYGINFYELHNKLSRRGKNYLAGTITTREDNFLVRTKSEYESIQDIEKIIIKSNKDGTKVYLKDIANCKHGFEEARIFQKRDSHQAIVLSVKKPANVNTLTLVPKVRALVDEYSKTIEKDIKIMTFDDSSISIHRRLKVLSDNLSLGMIFVAIILWLFMGLKNSVLALIGIPFSFLTGFVFMEMWGITINEISIFSLVIVSGMVVDDAIVILENMVSHHNQGKTIFNAAIDGASQVFFPIVASTLTTVSAFLPMVIMTGEMGRVMILIPITVAFILLASFVEAFLMLPCHFVELSKVLQYFNLDTKEAKKSLIWIKLEGYLERVLRSFLKKPIFSVIIFSVFFVAIATSPYILRNKKPKIELFPSDVIEFSVDVQFEKSTSVDDALKLSSPIERDIRRFLKEDILNLTSVVGAMFTASYEWIDAENLAQIKVELDNSKVKQVKVDQKITDLREHLRSKTYKGVNSFQVVKVGDGPRIGRPVAIRLLANDYDAIAPYAQQIYKKLLNTEGLENIEMDLRSGKPRLDVIVNEEKAALYQIEPDEIAQQVSMAVDGVIVGLSHWNQEEVWVKLKFKDDPSPAIDQIKNLYIYNKTGQRLYLSDVATIKVYHGHLKLQRFDQQSSIQITAGLSSTTEMSSIDINLKLKKYLKDLLEDNSQISFSLGGEFEETNKSLSSLMRAFLIAAFLMFAILATQFQSFSQPILIMLSIPYAFIGVLLGMGIYDLPFTMLCFIAMVGLAGVVVNDTIVLIDFINKLRKKMDLNEAIIEGTKSRVRAICLTTITTIMGLLPVVLEYGGKSTIWQPMAVAMCFGILSATFLTLLFVPSIYYIHANIESKLSNLLFKSS
ncbi:MAG: efflux RND transporter permease subunit [Candidatus Cloacimonetes bacterium]|nr:efflux RND transporter permease subunit [Candidatus Cloacimonadota bacterium]